MIGMDDQNAMADASIRKQTGETTGRFLVLLDVDNIEAGITALRSGAGVASAEHVRSDDVGATADILQHAGTVVFDELGVAVIETMPDQRRNLVAAAEEAPAVLAIEKERVLYACGTPDYLRGYRDGVADITSRIVGDPGIAAEPAGLPLPAWDESHATWGLQAILATETSLTGRDVGIAVLDTGIDLSHPDFSRGIMQSASFVPGEAVDDKYGHGTHCAGTACGPKDPKTSPRYGVATEAEIFIGKVLANDGSGSDQQILAGINWAVGQKTCRVVSMSLSTPALDRGYSRVYEQAARRAQEKGVLIIAAAGNDSWRPQILKPVGHPANCPTIVAVAAIAPDFTVAPFSCAGLNPNGGEIDLAAPGVGVFSTWRQPGTYHTVSGTSMAAPHVAGIAALIIQDNPKATAKRINDLLLARARPLPALRAIDVGKGLVQAP